MRGSHTLILALQRAAKAVVCLVVACCALAPKPSFASPRSGGSIEVVTSTGARVAYDAVRIADADGAPLDTAFDWEALAANPLLGESPFPAYDADGAAAHEQGKKLVNAVNDRVATDADGTFAQHMAAFVTDAGWEGATVIKTGAGPVSVADGWWLLAAEGRRPLLVWVDGNASVVGDKTDTPTCTKEVLDNETGLWGSSGTIGAGEVAHYRLRLTLPESMSGHTSYRVTLHDVWDAGLLLQEDSLSVHLLSGADEDDITAAAEVAVGASSFDVTISDVKALGARPGDVIEVRFSMSLDPAVEVGAEGLTNTAWSTYPSPDDEEEETPPDDTKVYTVRVRVHKTNTSDASLAGADFAVRNEAGDWLTADGTFGAEADRVEMVTDASGMATLPAPLAPGTYELVEVRAPEGYVLPQNPVITFTISADHTVEQLDFTVEIEGDATVEEISGEDASFVVQVVNTTQPPHDDDDEDDGGPVESEGQDDDLPGTGDVAGVVLIAAGAIVLVGMGLVALGRKLSVTRATGPRDDAHTREDER